MENAVRDSGIDVIGDVPWGTHFSLFYKTGDDLSDILVSFFRAGLMNNEFCMCVTSNPVNAEEMKRLMRAVLPDFDDHISRGQIEIIPYTEWYLIDGVFDQRRVLEGWNAKLRQAQERGFVGARLTGNTFWLDELIWKDFLEYEQSIDGAIAGRNIIALCTYSLDRCDAGDILDIVSTHQFALTRSEGKWKLIESVGLKETKRALRESEEKLRCYYDLPLIGMALTSAEKGWVQANDEICRILGYSREELFRKTWEDITYPDDLDKDMKNFNRLLSGEIESYTIEKRFVRKDGGIVFTEISIGCVRNPDKSVRFVVGLMRDITERKRAEERIAHLASFPELNKNPVIEITITGIIHYINSAAIKIFPDLEVMGGNHPIFMDFGQLKAELEKSETKSLIRDIKFQDKYYQEAISSIPEWSIIRFYLVDTTERNQVEEELKAEKAHAELYLDLMGHDISNMHQIAIGYLELARDLQRDDNVTEFINKPVEVLQRSARLIKNVRKLQKLRDGIFQTEVVDVCKVLVDVHREFGAVPNKTVTLNLNGYMYCHVRANELLHDVFANLVSNAIKHTGDRADIMIDLEILEEDGRRFCRVMVEDDGPGIPDDFKGRIFNRVLKGTDKAKGMGLGLYLVKSLVESYDGRVWVEDRVLGDHTKGARFVVMLPASEK
jgi:PAS domain S-box-containing protein